MTAFRKLLKKHGELIFAVCINLIVLFVAFQFSVIGFGTNDDRDISNILAGVYGNDHSNHIVFVNLLLCTVLAKLYELTSNCINWYVLISIICSFIALTSLSFLLLKRTKNKWIGCGLATFAVFTLYESHYITFQFTQNSVLLCFVGMLLLIDTLLHDWEKTSAWICVLGIFLSLMGTLIRFQCIYFVVPYVVFYCGYRVLSIRDGIDGIKSFLKAKWKSLTFFALAFLLILVARGTHMLAYNADPQLKAFYEDNLLRAELADYGAPSYEKYEEEYNAIGFTEEDVQCFHSLNLWDRSVFSHDALQKIVDMKGDSAYSLSNFSLHAIKATIKSILDSLKDNYLHWLVIFIAFVYFVFGTNRKKWLILLASLFFSLALNWYFVSVDRMPYRVWYSFMTPLVISSLYLCAIGDRALRNSGESDDKPCYCKKNVKGFALPDKMKKIDICVAFAAFAALAAANMIKTAVKDDSLSVTDTYEKIIHYAEEHSDALVLVDRPSVSALTYHSSVGPLTAFPRGNHQNIFYTGGWICWTPANQSTLLRYNAADFQNVIADGVEILLIDARTPEEKLSFLQRHYNEAFELEPWGTIEGTKIGIYKIVLGNMNYSDSSK